MEYLLAKEAGLLVEKEYMFPEWADMWYESHKDNITPTTQEHYKYTLRILKDGFNRRKIKDVKAYDIEQFLKKRPGQCVHTLRQHLVDAFFFHGKSPLKNIITHLFSFS